MQTPQPYDTYSIATPSPLATPPVTSARLAAATLVLAGLVAVAARAGAATIAVTTPADSGPGTLREAIERANTEPGTTIRLAGPDQVILLERELPPLRATGTVLDGAGATLREARGCERSGRKKGCDGLVVAGREVVVRNLRVVGFLLDGIAVRGPRAKAVRIEDVHAIDNLDDGIGISDGAGPVVVERAILMGNGFRTKGKGILVFSDANATIRDSVVVANRDGVTVSRRAKAWLERVVVAGNFDKGIGASAAQVRATAVSVLTNGREGDEPAPNGDGVRAGLDGRIDLRRSLIAGNGDAGVVVLDTSSASLIGCTIEANGGVATHADPSAKLEQR